MQVSQMSLPKWKIRSVGKRSRQTQTNRFLVSGCVGGSLKRPVMQGVIPCHWFMYSVHTLLVIVLDCNFVRRSSARSKRHCVCLSIAHKKRQWNDGLLGKPSFMAASVFCVHQLQRTPFCYFGSIVCYRAWVNLNNTTKDWAAHPLLPLLNRKQMDCLVHRQRAFLAFLVPCVLSLTRYPRPVLSLARTWCSVGLVPLAHRRKSALLFLWTGQNTTRDARTFSEVLVQELNCMITTCAYLLFFNYSSIVSQWGGLKRFLIRNTS